MSPLEFGLLALFALQPAYAFRSKETLSVSCPADTAVNTKGDCIDAATNAGVDQSCCDLIKTCQAELHSRLPQLNARIELYFGHCGVTKDDLAMDGNQQYHLKDNSKVCANECQAVPGLLEGLAEFNADRCTSIGHLAGEVNSLKMMSSIVDSLDGAFQNCGKPVEPTPKIPIPCDGQVFTTVQFDAISAALHADTSCKPGSCSCGPNPNGFYPVKWEGFSLYPNEAGHYPSIYGYYPNGDGCIPSPFSEYEYPDSNMVYPTMSNFNGQEKTPEVGGYDACGVVHKVDSWGQQL